VQPRFDPYSYIDYIEPPKTISASIVDLDFETFSVPGIKYDSDAAKKDPFNIARCGLHEQVRHPAAEILLMAYQFEGSDTVYIWAPGLPEPEGLLRHVEQGGLLRAHNVNTEYLWWNHWGVPRLGWPKVDWRQMRDTMTLASQFWLPLGLADCMEVLAQMHPEDEGLFKLATGTELINIFCKPHYSKTHEDQGALFDLPEYSRIYLGDPRYIEQSKQFVEYNKQDVRAQRKIVRYTPAQQRCTLEAEWALRVVNDRGYPVDTKFARALLSKVPDATKRVDTKIFELTEGKVTGASKTQRMVEFIKENGLPECSSVAKERIKEMLENPDTPEVVRTLLELRQKASKSSALRPGAFVAHTAPDGRCYGGHQFAGAGTLRDAGRKIQHQNLPSDVFPWKSIPELAAVWDLPGLTDEEKYDAAFDKAKELALNPEYHELMAEHALDLAAGSCRSLICAEEGHELIFADWSAVEAVSLSCEAEEKWRIEAFRRGEDIYLANSSRMFGKPMGFYDTYKKEQGHKHPDRKTGKTCELACGYQGGRKAMYRFGGYRLAREYLNNLIKEHGHIPSSLGLVLSKNGKRISPEDALLDLWVALWRKACPNIKRYWGTAEQAVKRALQRPGSVHYAQRLKFRATPGKKTTLITTLPSGRNLYYPDVRIITAGRWPSGDPRTKIVFRCIEGAPEDSEDRRSLIVANRELYGGKVVQNSNQALCADLMHHASVQLVKQGAPLIMRIHDELGLHAPIDQYTKEWLIEQMLDLPEWAKHYPLNAGAWKGKRFRKD
jgi:DNA polymerase